MAIFDNPNLDKPDCSVGQRFLDSPEKENSLDIRDEFVNTNNRRDVLVKFPKNILTFNDQTLRERVNYLDSINQEPKGYNNNL